MARSRTHEPGAQQRVLAALADGEVHSGQALARQAGVSRAAVWKAVEGLRRAGHLIEALPGRGYRALAPHPPLSAPAIEAALPAMPDRTLAVLEEIDSTSAHLRRSPPAGETVAVVLAERQTAARGRLGRVWVAPPGGIYLSVSWPYRHLERGPVGLSLAVGVCLAQRLRQAGIDRAGVKWPNDIWCDDAKLAGILVELNGDPMGACRVVIGVGINWRVAGQWPADLQQPVVGAADLVPALDRNQVAGSAVAAVLEACRQVPQDIASLLTQQWPRVDVLAGRPVRLMLPGRTIEGNAAGVDADGALTVDTPDGRERFVSGDVSVRPL